jgi:IS605 OrfB family transposase
MPFVNQAFTYSTRISPDPVLPVIAAVCGKVERGLHHHLASGGKLDPDTKRRVLSESGLPGRYYNGIVAALQGKHSAIVEQRKLQIKELDERIRQIAKKVERLEKDAAAIAADPGAKNAPKRIRKIECAIHGKKRKSDKLVARQARFVRELGFNVPSLCFGSKKLFNKQHHLKENSYLNHQEWLDDWQAARSAQFMLIGSQDEISGNKTCVSTVEADGSISLRLLVPETLRINGEKHARFTGLRFGYGHAEIVTAINAANETRVDVAKFQAETKKLAVADNLDAEAVAALRNTRNAKAKLDRCGHTTALTWRFVHDETGWSVFVSINRRMQTADWGFAHGAIGLDLNVGFISVMPVDTDGNPLKDLAFDLPIDAAALSSDRAKAVMGDAVKEIVDMALRQRRALVIENLEFQKKKAALKETVGADLARKLSSFAYNLFKAMIKSRAARFGVPVVEVNPAYTSHMGRAKYARPLGISVHRAAAAMIARRGMGLSEGLSASAELPLGNGCHVALSRPARIGRRHVWASWGRHFGRYKAARKNALDTAARNEGRSGGTRAADRTANPVPQGCQPRVHAGAIRHVAPTAARGTTATLTRGGDAGYARQRLDQV